MDDNVVGIMPIMMQLMLMVMSNHNVVGLMAQLVVAEVILFSYNPLRITDHLFSYFSSTLLCNIFLSYLGNQLVVILNGVNQSTPLHLSVPLFAKAHKAIKAI